MNSIDSNINFSSNSPEIKKRLESSENFNALNKEKLKQDTAEFAKSQTDDFKKENFIFRILRTCGSKDPKKTLKSIGLTIATVIGFAYAGNKLVKPASNVAVNKIDNFLLNGDNFLSKGYRAVADFFSKGKTRIAKGMAESNSKTIRNIYETFTTKKLGPVNPWAKTYPSGGKGIFAMTPPDVLETGLSKLAKVDDITKNIAETLENKALIKNLPNTIAETFFDKGADETAQVLQKLGVSEKNTVSILKNLNKMQAGNAAKDSSEVLDFLAKKLRKTDEKRISDLISKTFIKNGDKEASELLNLIGLQGDDAGKILTDLSDSQDKIKSVLSNLFNEKTSADIYDKMFKQGSYDNIETCRQMLKNLKGINPEDKEAVYKFLTENLADPKSLEKLRAKGINIPDETIEAFKSITNVRMDRGDLLHSWWPVNIIDKAGEKIAKLRGKEWTGFARGNYGNAMLKFGIMDGTMAKTLPARFLQKSVIFPTEYISNFVNDKSGFGVLLCASLFSLYNTAQDAPKGKKIPTVANDFASTIGNVALSMPLASALAYGAGTAKYLNTNIFTIIPKTLGKIAGMGIENVDGKIVASGSGLKRFTGGAIRLGLIMFFLMPKISKVVNGAIAKVLGKPYDPNEEKAIKEKEKQENEIIPELGITNKEFLEKMQSNPQALEKLQNDPMLQREVLNNPKVILDLLDNKEVQIKPKDKLLSPANQNFLTVKNKPSSAATPAQNSIDNSLNKTNLNNSSDLTKKDNIQSKVDTATYIPSSDYVVENAVDEEEIAEINNAIAKADRALERAQKYL